MIRKILKITGIASILLYTISVFSDSASDYQNAQKYIQSSQLSNQLNSSINQNNIPLPVNQNPPQAAYYKNPNSILSDAFSHVGASGSTGNLINQNTLNAPKYTVNLNSPEIQTGQLIQNNAAAISNGTYKDCNKQDVTKVVYTNQTCQTGVPISFPCILILNVSIQKQYHYFNLSENLSNRVSPSASSAIVHLDAKEGMIQSFSMHVHDTSNPWSCFQNYYLSINGNKVAQYHGSCGNRLGDLQFDAHNLQINFTQNAVQISLSYGNFSGSFTGSTILSVKQEKDIATDAWSSSCGEMPAACQITSQCLEPTKIKIISGVPVTRACWKFQDDYQCGSQMSSSCSALLNQGCTQIQSQCAQNIDGMCNLYSENWSCPSKQVIGKGISCGGKFYCLDGSCQQTSQDKNTEFGNGVSQLAGAVSAANDVKNQNLNSNVDPNAIGIFTGQESECRVDAVGIANCCADTGWGKGIFVNCTDQEKHLGQSKEAGLVVATGEYCYKKILGICVEHRKTYCIFPSKLSVDVQVSGRENQLGIGFGSGRGTNCSGISPREIQQINFSKIDFSNVVADIENQKTLPDFTQIGQDISKHITHKSNSQKPSPYSKGGL